MRYTVKWMGYGMLLGVLSELHTFKIYQTHYAPWILTTNSGLLKDMKQAAQKE